MPEKIKRCPYCKHICKNVGNAISCTYCIYNAPIGIGDNNPSDAHNHLCRLVKLGEAADEVLQKQLRYSDMVRWAGRKDNPPLEPLVVATSMRSYILEHFRTALEADDEPE